MNRPTYFQCIMTSKVIQLISLGVFVGIVCSRTLWGHVELHGPAVHETQSLEKEKHDKETREACERVQDGTASGEDYVRYIQEVFEAKRGE